VRVGDYRMWLRHLDRGDERPMAIYLARRAGSDEQYFVVQSQTHAGVTYRVAYRAARGEEYISCTCPAARYGLACKHCASALALVHPQEFRRLIREGATR